MTNVPELFGLPIATLALIVAGASFLLAVCALGWQISKHFLDGGRVKVYLNVATWEPGMMLVTNQSGKWELDAARLPAMREYFEVAQLVVENPGRTPVTLYSPGLAISGTRSPRVHRSVAPESSSVLGRRIRNHTLTPRMFEIDSLGSDSASSKSVVRLEPYDRVAFAFDYWSSVPSLLARSGPRGIAVRGLISVAGRRKRPQQSSRALRWRIRQGSYSVLGTDVRISPATVIWRELWRHAPSDGSNLTRDSMTYVLEPTMDKFDQRPTPEEFQQAFEHEAKSLGFEHPAVASAIYQAFEILDRLDGHLSNWRWKPVRAIDLADEQTMDGKAGE